MLIKATRIRTATGATALARHLTQGDENEAIVVVRGTVADLHDAVADAKRFSRLYALRHFVIAPEIVMDRQQFERAARALADEFGFDSTLALVVEHKKSRAIEGVADRHWHIIVAETDPATGKVLSSRFSHPRHEKLARILELEFGHPIVPGAHDIAVMAALRSEGHSDLADRLAGALGQGSKPVEAFTTKAHQAAKRGGLDLAQARQHVRLAWAASDDGNDFRARLAVHGLELTAGEKAGVIVIRTIAGGIVLGAANRIAGARRADLNAFLERIDHDHQQPAAHTEHRPDNPFGNAGASPGRGNDIGNGPLDSPAAGRRESVGVGNDGQPTSDDRGRGGTEPAGHRGSAPAARRAWDLPGASAHDRRGLTDAIAKAGVAIMALSKTGIGESQIERTRQHLAVLETQARARIAATEAQSARGVSNRMHAARLYRDGSHARHAEALNGYRAAQKRLAAFPEPVRSLKDRLFGRQPDRIGIEALEQDVAAARADLISAEKSASGADGHLARVEKSESADRIQHMGQVETQRRAAMEMLAEIIMAQRMVRAFPALAYTGPSFTAWSAGKIEQKRRRGMWDPWARNIWGIPLDFG